MLALSRSLNIEVVVEGVEIAEQVRRFWNMGFTTFQGYYFSRPLTGEDCLAFIRQLDSKRSGC